MPASIPASDSVNITPSVIAAGGTGVSLNGLLLTNSTRLAVGAVTAFASAANVSSYFGAASNEAALAAIYFAGYDNSQVKPASLAFASYQTAAVGAWLRGASLSTMTLTQLQALSGTLILTVNGAVITSATINLSAATSFSNAAALINTGLANAGVTASTATSTTLTVTANTGSPLAVGQQVSGAGIPAGTYISALGTGTGGTGTYILSQAATATASGVAVTATAVTVTYDAIASAFLVTNAAPAGATSTLTYCTGTLSANLKLTSAAGATLSQGAAISAPAAAMNAIVAQLQNFVSFATTFQPAISDMLNFATWNGQQSNRYAYILWDNDINATTSNDTTSALYQINQASIGGTVYCYDPTSPSNLAMFVMGAIASIDFTRTNGRATLCYRSQSGIVAGVTNQTTLNNLTTNGGNAYVAEADASSQYNFFKPGQITGSYKWIDSFIGQVWMNAQFQDALLALLRNVRSIPYNAVGYAMIDQALSTVIANAINSGIVRPGVSLSGAEIAAANAGAGLPIDGTLASRGWYLQVKDPGATVRGARGTPIVNFWYMDGQSVQAINMSSVELI